VSAQEMQRLVMQEAQRYRQEDRERFFQYIQNEPMAAAQLRAPLYEDKVVDFLFEKADVTDRVVTREELEAAIEAEDGADSKGHVHGPDCDHDHDHKPAAKKAPAKKAAPKKAAAEEAAPAKAAEAAEPAKPAAKKAPTKKVTAKEPIEKEVEAKPAAKKPAKKADAK